MRAWCLAAVVTFAGSVVTGQVPNVGAPLAPVAWYDTALGASRARRPAPRDVSERARSYAPIVSAIIPGGGQVLLGNDRFIGYVAVEALTWWKYSKDVREQREQESAFKSLARRQARSRFTNESPDLLPDGNWAYYEKMRDFKESGSFSLSSSGPVVPETDVTTYNGSRWALAQSTYSSHEAALQQYMEVAVRPEFAWSWKSADFQFDIFKRTTDKRNDAHRAGYTDLMILGANHILSMIDAFTTIRLRASTDASGATSIGARVQW
jgi:hypothetical protein